MFYAFENETFPKRKRRGGFSSISDHVACAEKLRDLKYS